MAVTPAIAAPAGVTVLIPVFNDWAAVRLLLIELDRSLARWPVGPRRSRR